MKELSVEEKAKAYDELFVKAKQIYNKENDVLILHTIEDFFPELTKPDDKKIRKAIIGFFSEPGRKEYILNGFTVDDIIAWLEKQGEKIDAIENFDTEFEKQVSRLLASVLSKEYEYTKSFVKWVSNSLLGYAKHELEKQSKQNITWSEEDDKRLQSCLNLLQARGIMEDTETVNTKWLKSLKDRVQPKQEWSEEDERNFQNIDSVLFYDKGLPEDTCMRLRNWLKSLRSQSTWKPSDEQMNAFDAVLVYNPPCSNECRNYLITLYNDLKKLMKK